jgi:hypothetical protein
VRFLMFIVTRDPLAFLPACQCHATDTPCVSGFVSHLRKRVGPEVIPPARVALAQPREPVPVPRSLPPHPCLDVRHVEAVRATDPYVREVLQPSGSKQLPHPVARPPPTRDETEILRDLCKPDELAHGHPPLPEGRLRVNLCPASLLSAGPSPGGAELGGAAVYPAGLPLLENDGPSTARRVSNEI